MEELQFNTTYVLEESTDLANFIGMNRDVEVVCDPYDFSIFRCDIVVGDFKWFKKILDKLLVNDMNFMIKAMLCSGHGTTSPSLGLSRMSTP
ncbi:hypothetical protein QYE76_028201 [Lolium multiflorum]|uniref:Uncharacterized protein n=1 Tax=Lolium multiflorum TaxID=4521 RepID=A0AAD8QP22_LOLMU|nr:hypothetical protein QYE76_028201 [Lolium multiflorum]